MKLVPLLIFWTALIAAAVVNGKRQQHPLADQVLGETAKRHVHPTRKNRLMESLAENPPEKDSDIGRMIYRTKGEQASPEKAMGMPKLVRKSTELGSDATVVSGASPVTATVEGGKTKKKRRRNKKSKKRGASSQGTVPGMSTLAAMKRTGGDEGSEISTKAGIVQGFLNMFKSKKKGQDDE